MSPFSSLLFSQSKVLPSQVNGKEEKPVEKKRWKIIPPKKSASNHPGAVSLPVRHGQGFSRNLYEGPEEEIFPMSLESPVTRLSQTFDWLDQRDDFSCSLFANSYSEMSPMPQTTYASALELDSGRGTSSLVTPVRTPYTASINQEAPPRHKKVGRSGVLSRFVHKYECEDFMEYAVDIFGWKKSIEDYYQPGEWENVQSEVTSTMRMSLLSWMVDISRELEFSLETWCLAVNYLDRFLESQVLSKDCLQLAGLTTLWLGAKQEELFPPSTDELVSLCADSYSAMNFKHMELIILAKLKFNLAAPTPAFYLSHLVAVQDEKDWSEDLSRHLVELVMEDHILARLSPSRIAHSVFKVIKACDVTAIRILEGSCPKCEPQNTDQWCRDFFEACLQRVVDVLTV